MAISITLVVLALAWYGLELLRHRTRAMPGGIDASRTLPHERTWELYHNSFSLCSKKTRVCLAELGIEYRSHHVDLIETGAYENVSRRYLAVNPAALVPLLVHEGHPIYESHEQIVYAAAAAAVGDGKLLTPEDDRQRAIVDHWVRQSSLLGEDPIAGVDETAGNAVPGLTLPIFAAMIESIPVHRILFGLLFHRFKVRPLMFLAMKRGGAGKLPRMKPLVGAIRRSRTAMHRHLDELEGALEGSGGAWILGSRFSLADVGMMAILDRLREVDWLDTFLTEARPRVAAYWNALQARPSYAAAIGAFEHPTVMRGLDRVRHLKETDAAFRAALTE